MTPMQRFIGKTAVVTGGTGAIGSAICRRLLAEGARVGVGCRCMSKAAAMLRQLGALSQWAYPLHLDVTDSAQLQTALEQFAATHGRLDILVNNAGGGAREAQASLEQQSVEVIDRVLHVNLRGSILCARTASRLMMAQGYGRIINIGSVVGMCGQANNVEYAAAKAGVVGLTRALALEVGARQVTVNCVIPGLVNQTAFDEQLAVRPSQKTCVGRFGYTAEVAAAVAFLASSEAAFITGAELVVDGGRSLGLRGDSP